MVQFIILLHKVIYDYVTVFNVYECAISRDLLEAKIKQGEKLFEVHTYYLVEPAVFEHHEGLASPISSFSRAECIIHAGFRLRSVTRFLLCASFSQVG